MISRIFNSKTKTVTSAAFLLAISSLISRVLGFLRDRLLVSKFGLGYVSDIYFTAFRIPDFVYNILIVGAIAVAFLPVFSEYFKDKKEAEREEVWPEEVSHFTNNLLNCFFVLLVFSCLVLAIFTPWIINLIAPGFSAGNKSITVGLTRIMFLSPILFGISSIFSGILQYFERFLIYSIAPILYNLGIILGILFLTPILGIYGLGYGVVIGAFLYFAIQYFAVKSLGFKYKPILDFKHLGIKKVFKLMGPRIIGVAADNINLIIITAIASTLAIGSISAFTISNNFQYLPVGIIGISFAVSSFPVFSKYMANNQKKEFYSHFSIIFRQISFLIIPISILSFLLRAQIIRLLYGAGNFDWDATRLTAACLGVFCLGILANSLMPLVGRAFFSFQDTKTPVINGLICVVLNVFFSIFFIYLFKNNYSFGMFWIWLLKLQNLKNIEVLALPLGFSLASIIETISLIVLLYRKIGDFGIKEIFSSYGKIIFSCVFLIISTYLALYFASLFVNMQTFWGIFWQTFVAGSVGFVSYFFVAYILKMQELDLVVLVILKKMKLNFR